MRLTREKFGIFKAFDICEKNKYRSGADLIETIKVIKTNEIIADTNFIHATYRIAGFNVKHSFRKIRPVANKKGNFMGSDSPPELGLQNAIQKNFKIDMYRIVGVMTGFGNHRFVGESGVKRSPKPSS